MNRHLALALPLALLLSACGVQDDEQASTDLPFGLDAGMDCMKVHGAVLQVALGPLAVVKGGPEAESIISGLHDTAAGLPDQADMPRIMDELADMIDGVKGQGVEAAKALAESPGFQQRAQVLSGWHQAHCQQAES